MAISLGGRFWDHVGTILGPFWYDFGTILGRFWNHFREALLDRAFRSEIGALAPLAVEGRGPLPEGVKSGRGPLGPAKPY